MSESIHRLPVFLTKMLQMVSRGKESIVRWDSTGHSVIIKDVDKFVEEVLPKYFKMKKFTSFVRQLNLYGFRKISSEIDPNQCEFFHPYFRQGKTELLSHIVRRTKVRNISKFNTINRENDEKYKEMNETIKTLRSELEEQNKKYIQLLSEYNILKQSIKNDSSPQNQIVPLTSPRSLPPCLVNRLSVNENENNFFDGLSPLIDDHNRISYLINLNQAV